MTYLMLFKVDGACNNNGKEGPKAAASAVCFTKWRKHKAWTRELPLRYPTPTNQRAELAAIIMALELALERFYELRNNPWLDVRIKSDSEYAIKCLTVWYKRWATNGWIGAKGTEVANRDLIEEALDLESRLREEGDVSFEWIPREQNTLADRYCKEAANDM